MKKYRVSMKVDVIVEIGDDESVELPESMRENSSRAASIRANAWIIDRAGLDGAYQEALRERRKTLGVKYVITTAKDEVVYELEEETARS